MSIPKLYCNAEACIQIMHLNQNDQQVIRNCLSKYSFPDTFCKRMCWLMYRVINAIKSIFGHSDWQIAKKVIQNRAMQMAIERGLIQKNPQDRIQKAIKAGAVSYTNVVAKGLLSMGLLLQEKQFHPTDAFNQKLNGMNLESLVEKLRSLQRTAIRREQDLPISQFYPIDSPLGLVL